MTVVLIVIYLYIGWRLRTDEGLELLTPYVGLWAIYAVKIFMIVFWGPILVVLYALHFYKRLNK